MQQTFFQTPYFLGLFIETCLSLFVQYIYLYSLGIVEQMFLLYNTNKTITLKRGNYEKNKESKFIKTKGTQSRIG